MDPISQKKLIKQAIVRAGGVTRVAREFDINRLSVYGWVENGRVPARRCPDMERLTGGEYRCEELCPDVDWSYLRRTRTPTEEVS